MALQQEEWKHRRRESLPTSPMHANVSFNAGQGILRQLPLVPMRQKEFREELSLLTDWYNEHRPHMILAGRTPDEVYHNRFPANRKPRYEPRSRWPRGSPCANPWALTRGRPGARLELDLTFLEGRKHLPIVALKRAA
jgi:hypothetical protein